MLANTKLAFLLHLSLSTFAQKFTLQHSYTGLGFFDRDFTFYSGYDPTFGYVHYVDLATAEQHGMVDLINVTNTGIARWGVETVDVLDPSANLGRMSIRLQSTATYKHGLFVLDVAHIPGNICGVWPAFWMVGTGVWPSTGEIDIIETTNNGPNNVMSLHSALGKNCTIAGANQRGTLLTNDCAYADSYTGCAVSAPSSGTAFNAAGGGVYAMLWTSNGIQMWSFARNSIPPSLRGGAARIEPNLAEFGMPTANFQGSCDFDAHLSAQQIIFNTDFCGSNAGQTFQVDGCPMTVADSWPSCNVYVAANPSAFTEAYWEVNFLNVYEMSPNVALPLSKTQPMSTTAGATWPASWTVPAPFSPFGPASSPPPGAGTDAMPPQSPAQAPGPDPRDHFSLFEGVQELDLEVPDVARATAARDAPLTQSHELLSPVLTKENNLLLPFTAHSEISQVSWDVPLPATATALVYTTTAVIFPYGPVERRFDGEKAVEEGNCEVVVPKQDDPFLPFTARTEITATSWMIPEPATTTTEGPYTTTAVIFPYDPIERRRNEPFNAAEHLVDDEHLNSVDFKVNAPALPFTARTEITATSWMIPDPATEEPYTTTAVIFPYDPVERRRDEPFDHVDAKANDVALPFTAHSEITQLSWDIPLPATATEGPYTTTAVIFPYDPVERRREHPIDDEHVDIKVHDVALPYAARSEITQASWDVPPPATAMEGPYTTTTLILPRDPEVTEVGAVVEVHWEEVPRDEGYGGETGAPVLALKDILARKDRGGDGEGEVVGGAEALGGCAWSIAGLSGVVAGVVGLVVVMV